MGAKKMNEQEKTIQKIMSGRADGNIKFVDLQHVLKYLGFDVRIKGDHFIYTKEGVEEIINIQPVGNKAKNYQVRQVRNIILKYKL